MKENHISTWKRENIARQHCQHRGFNSLISSEYILYVYLYYICMSRIKCKHTTFLYECLSKRPSNKRCLKIKTNIAQHNWRIYVGFCLRCAKCDTHTKWLMAKYIIIKMVEYILVIITMDIVIIGCICAELISMGLIKSFILRSFDQHFHLNSLDIESLRCY